MRKKACHLRRKFFRVSREPKYRNIEQIKAFLIPQQFYLEII
jgi:hypothetical protein